MYYLIIGLLGAVVTILIAVVSRGNFYLLSALIPFFPTFSLIAYFMVHQRGNIEELGNVIQFNLISLAPFIAFAVTMYVLHTMMGFYSAIALSLLIWLLTALLTYYLYNMYA